MRARLRISKYNLEREREKKKRPPGISIGQKHIGHADFQVSCQKTRHSTLLPGFKIETNNSTNNSAKNFHFCFDGIVIASYVNFFTNKFNKRVASFDWNEGEKKPVNRKRKKEGKRLQKLPCEEVDGVRPLPRSLNVLEMARASVRADTLSIPSSMSRGSRTEAGGAAFTDEEHVVIFSSTICSIAGVASKVTIRPEHVLHNLE